MPSYNPKVIEPRWQRYWDEHKTFRTPDVSAKPKYYILDMFPYPSGAGLHVGHPEGYTATDILARYKRMRGFNVLHPMGWDAFGLPAEQYAVEHGTHPRTTTQKNINEFRRQIKMLGFSYDWEREVDTTDPAYFKWTQWIFLELYDTWYDSAARKGRPIRELPIPDEIKSEDELAVRKYQDSRRLAYQAEVPVNWCEFLGTVLANEEVIDGKSERGGHPVVRMPLRQWLLRITAYADRLLDDLELVAWPDSIKKMQRDWIGKSTGAEVAFLVSGEGLVVSSNTNDRSLLTTLHSPLTIRVFTTRPDTLFGATYMVLAPEHPLVERITTPEQKQAVAAYKTQAARKSDMERSELTKLKTGVFTGAYAVNPVNEERIPIWIADYVLASYGTGAIMAVPAHDERDFEFARQFQLPIRTVVEPPPGVASKTECFADDGIAVNSGPFTGLTTAAFKDKIIAALEENQQGQKKINYKLRDWLFSRQRYWGEPFPILHEVDAGGKPTGIVEPLTLSDLPLVLPELEDYKPSGQAAPPLGKAKDWLKVTRNGKHYVRETNTMPQWAGSCWYYLRFLDPKNDESFCDPTRQKNWLPIDLYVGGAEHAVLHLLYSRFWHKVLFDRGHVATPEPFQRLVNQGMILGMVYYVYQDADGNQVSLQDLRKTVKYEQIRVMNDDVEEIDGEPYLKGTKLRLLAVAEKMSKARKNVINPDTVVNEYGADSLRLYEMFMGPLEATKPWSMRGVEGVSRFLNRVWRLAIDDRAEELKLQDSVQDVEPDKETKRLVHLTIKRVTDDLDKMSFNTAIAAMMEFTNHLTPQAVRPRSVLKTFALLLNPFAPHLAEELWLALRAEGGNAPGSLAYEHWPTYDESLLVADEVEIPVQINGKLRAKLMVATVLDKATLEKIALADEKVRALLEGKTIKKVIVVPGKLVNIVVE